MTYESWLIGSVPNPFSTDEIWFENLAKNIKKNKPVNQNKDNTMESTYEPFRCKTGHFDISQKK